MFNPTEIARICHEANRALTAIVGDVQMQPPWESAPEEMQLSSIRGVQFALTHPDATPEAQHDAWAKDKIASGWKFGDAKDEAAKTHPALKPYADLPEGTRRKDALFRAVVAALR